MLYHNPRDAATEDLRKSQMLLVCDFFRGFSFKGHATEKAQDLSCGDSFGFALLLSLELLPSGLLGGTRLWPSDPGGNPCGNRT